MRCRACNIILDEADLKRKADDWDYCSECRYQSNKKFNATDKQYHHGDITGVPLDGSTLTLEDWHTPSEDN